MTTFVRSLSSLAALRRAVAGRTMLAAGLAAVLSATLLLTAAPAGAVVTEVGGTKVGLQPRDVASVRDGGVVGEFANANGGAVLPATDTYVVYWDPTYSYHGNWEHIVNVFMQGLGAGSGSLASVFAVDAQYTDRANQHASYQSSFHGAYTDRNHYPTTGNCTDPSPLHGGRAITCLTGEQVREQLETFIAQHDLPKGMETVYYLLTPPGVTVCLEAGHCSDYPGTPEEIEADEAEHTEPEADQIYKDSFCSYHADINPDSAANGDANTILYAVIPWIAGGEGDFHLALEDRTAAYDCQDGGFYFNPQTSTEEKEHPVVSTQEEEEAKLAAEKKEVEELTGYEEQYEKGLISEGELEEKKTELGERRARREVEEDQEREKREQSEGPHEQEPNQDGRGEDGSYDTGLADLIVSQIGIEQQDVITDPLLDSWQDSAGNEATDECRNFFAPTIGGSLAGVEFTDAGTLFNQSLGGVSSYIPDAFDLAAEKLDYPGVPCLVGVSLLPRFTPPNPVNAGEIVGLDGMESDITLDAGVKFSSGGEEEPTYPVFTWNFGDGSPEVSGYAPGAPSVNSPEASPCEAPWLAPCAASVFHSYQYGGTYEVTLTVKDVAGDTASTSRQITVVGPPPPSPSPGGGSPSGSGGGTSGGSSGGASGGGSPAGVQPGVPAPLAAAAILRQRLRNALHKGLAVGYSVNEQVAGHFEVLLSRSVAHRLRIGGAPAVGLPAGSPAEVVIAKAILITTKGGHSKLRIRFSRHTAARLARIHKLSLMLRLTVRNAASGTPATTTVLSRATLHR